jgi:hypothetical protein
MAMQPVRVCEPPQLESVCRMSGVWTILGLGKRTEGKRGLSTLPGKGGSSASGFPGSSSGQGKIEVTETKTWLYETDAEACGSHAGMGGESRGYQSGNQRPTRSEQCGTGHHQGATRGKLPSTGTMEGQRENIFQEGNGVPSAEGGFQHERVSEEKLEIRTIYTELEEIGWNQVVSDDGEDGDSVSSDDAEAYMAANANAARRADRARETPEEKRARRARNMQGPPAVVDLVSDDDDMGVQRAQGPARQPQAAAAGPQAARPAQAEAAGAQAAAAARPAQAAAGGVQADQV